MIIWYLFGRCVGNIKEGAKYLFLSIKELLFGLDKKEVV